MSEKLVITGMGVITPIGSTVEDYWKNLTDSKCGIGPIESIDAEEIGQLADIAVPVTLGPRILRTETAAISAIAGVMLLKGELD